MDAMLQRHCARYIYVIPDGLRELMSDISREVLRAQPEDFYTFIADYLNALMITRENARVAARLVESLTEMATTTAMFLEETGMSRDEVDNIVTAIQTTFRRSIDSEEGDESEETNVVADILQNLNVTEDQAGVAAAIIQNAYRRFKERKEREKQLLAGIVDWRVAARSAIRLYRKTGVTNEEANRAVTLIKAAYKGYYTRKMMMKLAQGEAGFTPELPYDCDFDEYYDGEHFEDVGVGTDDDIRSEGLVKSVTIDYNTVIPHVAFDTTSGGKERESIGKKISSASSVAKYSLKYIFDSVLEKVGDVITEETVEEGDGNVVKNKESPVETKTTAEKQMGVTTKNSPVKVERPAKKQKSSLEMMGDAEENGNVGKKSSSVEVQKPSEKRSLENEVGTEENGNEAKKSFPDEVQKAAVEENEPKSDDTKAGSENVTS